MQSETRTIILYSGGQQARLSVKTKRKKKYHDLLYLKEQNKNTKAKTGRDVSLLKTFLQRKVELGNVEEIPSAKNK